MAGMRRRVFTISSALLLVLCVTTSIVWPLGFAEFHRIRKTEAPWTEWFIHNGAIEHDAFTVRYNGTDAPSATITQLLVVPVWPLFLASTTLPVLWVWDAGRRGRMRRRARQGHCPACGYDLRATPDRCPECGAVPATK